MSTQKLSIHRSLSELKVIGQRIEKAIEEFIPSGIRQKDKLVNGTQPLEKFEGAAKEKFQSVNDLIERRNKIKSAIVKSNGITEVTIAGIKMTVADAINMKAAIVFRKKLIEVMKKRHTSTKATLAKNNEAVNANSLDLAKVALGKQNVKASDEDVKKATELYLENNTFMIVDPLDADRRIEELEKSITDFETEVDAILSESNAITQIEL